MHYSFHMSFFRGQMAMLKKHLGRKILFLKKIILSGVFKLLMSDGYASKKHL